MHLLESALQSGWGMLQTTLVIYGLAICLERYFPAQRNQPLAGLAANVQYTVIFMFMTAILLAILNPLGTAAVDALGGHHVRIPQGEAYATKLALNFLWFFVFDFFYYWHHRMQHTLTALWQIHKVHHSDQGLNVTTTNMHHWLEEPLRIITIVIPMGVFCDLKPVELGLATVILNLWGAFIHTNLRLELGWLTPVIAGPQYHRVHHSNLPQHTDKNFAAFFPFWDILFRTYVRPEAGEFPTTGLHGGEVPENMIARSLWPFQGWAAMLGMSRRRSPSGASTS
jgi:sterol desaturase/sphingolipid hydroxylase (fatty acid hydroxylase superfamily)